MSCTHLDTIRGHAERPGCEECLKTATWVHLRLCLAAATSAAATTRRSTRRSTSTRPRTRSSVVEPARTGSGATSTRSSSPGLKRLEEELVREAVDGVAAAARHRLRGEHRVQDRLLDRVDHGLVERVDPAVVQHPQRQLRARRRRGCGCRSRSRARSRRSSARPSRPSARSRTRPAARARSHCPGRSGASVAIRTMIEPAPSPAPLSGSGTTSGPIALADRDRRSRAGARRRPWLAWTSTPTIQPSSTTRDAVPIPPLKPWQTMPVPPPTEPSSTGPSCAASSAAETCSGRTWKPLMSLRKPSHVSPTTGRLQSHSPGRRRGDQRVADDADRVRVREADRRRQRARVADPLEPGQLAVAVDRVRARRRAAPAAARRR